MTIHGINHIALHVADVAVSVRFYTQILQLQPLPRPAFDFDGAWFCLGENQELHLIGGRIEAVFEGSRANHFAVEVADLDAWQVHLETQKASFRPPKARPDGLRQLFITDPDGHCIELLGR
jgi:lactoylglutathione lyase